MTDKFALRDESSGNERHFDSLSEAEEEKSKLVQIGAKPEDLSIVPPGESPDSAGSDEPETPESEPESEPEPTTDGGGQTMDPEVVDHTERPSGSESGSEPNDKDVITSPDDLENRRPQLQERSVSDDPLQWVPGEFVDTIDGTQAINRKGFAVLSHFYEIETSSEVITPPEDTDFTFCRVKAVATTTDGRQYEAHGSAHVDRGDDSFLLLEMADTRAKKRALADATGVGAVAVSELKSELNGGGR